MYLLFVDESGTHAGSHAFVLGALAIHEDDAPRLQRQLDELVIAHLDRLPVNLEEYELHAGEMRNAKKPKDSSTGRVSIWATTPRTERLSLLTAAYELVRDFDPVDAAQSLALFGVVVDPRFHSNESPLERERFAYEVLLNKFDLMLKKLRTRADRPNRGLVIHDRRVVAEQDIQAWTTEWRAAAGKVGQLRNLADVPLFTDSRATRLLQVADLISYALYRGYNPAAPDDQYLHLIWDRFHRADGKLHGCVHFNPQFGSGTCACDACTSRQA
ncbi:MAG: DUF3800 domain-containing protein [Dermatophilaceae bacterium]